MRRLRVGRISLLNMYPIYHGLERTADPMLSFTDGVPTDLNRALLRGELDVSAMSSIEYARHAGELTLVPVASITADGAVDSIQLFSRVPFDEVRTVAVTPHSATSVALLRILLGPGAPFRSWPIRRRAALERVDGVLLIGDEALVGAARAHRAAPHRPGRPLARAHRAADGLRGVGRARRGGARALRGARRPGDAPAAHARAAYLADPEAVVRPRRPALPLPGRLHPRLPRPPALRVRPRRAAGLEAFLRLARECGELDAVPRLAA